jgi:two-component system chemotaxis response regulator CheY
MSDSALERLKVMVVDDNHHMANIVKTILRGFGVKTFIDADTAAEAYDLFLGEDVDLVITDFAMEPTDGRELVRLIRTAEDSRNRYVPILMLSAYSERSKVEAARDAGINEFCAKPVTATELYRKIHAIINVPRPYVRTREYFGPDRRRRIAETYEGDERRDSNHAPDSSTLAEDDDAGSPPAHGLAADSPDTPDAETPAMEIAANAAA